MFLERKGFKIFLPKRIIFEKDALEYEMGKQLYDQFVKREDIEVHQVNGNRVKSKIPGENQKQQYENGKETLVVGVKKSLKFQSCKPSAHYQLPLVSGCMGQCEYCYLNTQLGDKPYVRIHVNLEDILERASQYAKERLPEITIFEGAATSDPLPVEPYTNALAKCISFFGSQEHMRFRFVSKYTDVEGFLQLEHNGHTEIRFSINTQQVITSYEHHTPSAKHRIQAANKVMSAGYPVGFLIAPVFFYENWKQDYEILIKELAQAIPENIKYPVTLEIISHRYTLRAKEIITQVFPNTTLPMKEEERTFQYGQFGYGKYKYKKEELKEMEQFFLTQVKQYLPQAVVKYII